MDVLVTRFQERFTWDSEKAASNLAKHGVTFERALEVFSDPFSVLLDAGTDDDARLALIGADLDSKLLFVVHLEWADDSIRIISARAVTLQERRTYENTQ